MTSSYVVDDASTRAAWMVQRESRGPGDALNAMRRLEARYGIPYGLFWSLRYRKPKDIWASVYFALRDAHEAECDRQARLLDQERARVSPQTRIGRALVGSTENMGRADPETLT